MEQFLEIWILAQTMLCEQIRWKRFLKIDPEIRKQDVLQHTYAATIHARPFFLLWTTYKFSIDFCFVTDTLLARLQRDEHGTYSMKHGANGYASLAVALCSMLQEQERRTWNI